tara:strand:- start:524 stop:697 length:174 start_codon:yes stop_codon:yes gene_type:complete
MVVKFTSYQYKQLVAYMRIKLKGVRGASTKNRRIRHKYVSKAINILLEEVLSEIEER